MSQKTLKKLFVTLLFIGSWGFLYAQGDEWIKVYGEDRGYVLYDMIETYDNGYLLSGQSMSSVGAVEYGLLIKTDVNGEVLWEKMVGANPPPGETGTLIVKQLNDGSFIISGSTLIYDNYFDAFILKLNECGEKEWSKVFTDPNMSQFSSGIQIMDNGTYLIQVAYWHSDLGNDRIWLFNIDQNGEIIWQKSYANWTLGTNNEDGCHLLKNSNNEYLISGWYYQSNPGEDTNSRYTRPMYIKIDSLGNEIWHQLWGINDYFYGTAFKSAFDSKGNIYGVGRNESYNEQARGPVLFKLENDGTQSYYKDLIEDADGGNTTTISIMDDSTIFIGANWYDFENISHNRILKTDTLGNIIDQRELFDKLNTFTSSLITFDNKYLVAGSFVTDVNWDIYMWKLNKDLEYDSIYTQPRVYDSLCPYQIISDTIELDTTIINLKELYDNMHRIKVHPNPASSKLIITLGDFAKGTEIILYNTNGQVVKQQQLQGIKREYEFNIFDLPTGLYVVVLLDNGRIAEREKVLIQR